MGDQIAQILLESKAVTLRPSDPFTYASGMKGPIYCDNRLLLSFPEHREQVIQSFLKIIDSLEFDVLAGTATAGIAWSAWLARELNKPMVYIRGKAKDHGKQNLIEGQFKKGQKLLIVEDLVTSGGSSISAVEAAREAGAIVTDCVAIFSYALEKSIQKFKEAECTLHTLTELPALIETAVEQSLLSTEEKQLVLAWQKNPGTWAEKQGFA